ncbi:MAG: class SAM-dependent methyltransferase [Gammaproteobacteria bacterium]|jgi:SAM-dependent methyltransferase|nr:class SAM-dependent methyltransferase [Gammaproteobacteria bacterium]
MRGLRDAVLRRAFPPRLAYYPQCKSLVRGRGLEIGGPSDVFKSRGLVPIYPLASRIDNCAFSRETVWHSADKFFRFDPRKAVGTQFTAEATDLKGIEAESYDFVMSSHALEHVANPLKALSEWVRVLKPAGLLVLILPNRDQTFDHRRPVTSMAHLIADRDQQRDEADLTHLPEILDLHDLTRDPGAGTFEEFKARALDNVHNRCLHHHVFDSSLAAELVRYVGLRVRAAEIHPPHHIVVIGQKP